VLRTALRGYDRRAVDEFLARCAASLGPRVMEFPELRGIRCSDGALPRLDAGDVRQASFAVVLRGYEPQQVDALLERVMAALPGEEARPAWADPDPAGGAAPSEPLALRLTVRGYDMREVDEFLVRCAHSLGPRVDSVPELRPLLASARTGEPLRARDVEVAQFRIRTRGYDVESVDDLLDRVARALSR
jgi:DivIVA domain-containing protein